MRRPGKSLAVFSTIIIVLSTLTLAGYALLGFAGGTTSGNGILFSCTVKKMSEGI